MNRNRITPTLSESVEMVLDYLWDTEELDFEETDLKGQRPRHIFEALIVLRSWHQAQCTPDALKCSEGSNGQNAGGKDAK